MTDRMLSSLWPRFQAEMDKSASGASRTNSSGYDISALCTPFRATSVSSSNSSGTVSPKPGAGLGISSIGRQDSGSSRFPWMQNLKGSTPQASDAPVRPEPVKPHSALSRQVNMQGSMTSMNSDPDVDSSLSDVHPGGRFEVPEYPDGLLYPLPAPTRAGVVLLSEFATASSVMNSHMPINPWAVIDIAWGILDQALRMTAEERLSRQWRDYQYILKHPCSRWSQSARDFIDFFALRMWGCTYRMR